MGPWPRPRSFLASSGFGLPQSELAAPGLVADWEQRVGMFDVLFDLSLVGAFCTFVVAVRSLSVLSRLVSENYPGLLGHLRVHEDSGISSPLHRGLGPGCR